MCVCVFKSTYPSSAYITCALQQLHTFPRRLGKQRAVTNVHTTGERVSDRTRNMTNKFVPTKTRPLQLTEETKCMYCSSMRTDISLLVAVFRPGTISQQYTKHSAALIPGGGVQWPERLATGILFETRLPFPPARRQFSPAVSNQKHGPFHVERTFLPGTDTRETCH